MSYTLLATLKAGGSHEIYLDETQSGRIEQISKTNQITLFSHWMEYCLKYPFSTACCQASQLLLVNGLCPSQSFNKKLPAIKKIQPGF